jgi:hypothetical protein
MPNGHLKNNLGINHVIDSVELMRIAKVIVDKNQIVFFQNINDYLFRIVSPIGYLRILEDQSVSKVKKILSERHVVCFSIFKTRRLKFGLNNFFNEFAYRKS